MKEKGKIRINVNDIIGKRLGKLQVISYEGYRYDITHGGERVRHCYMVECDCGKTKIMRRNMLKHDLVKSCGCSKKERYHGY